MKKQIILPHQNPDVDSIVSGVLLEKLLTSSKVIDAEFVIQDKVVEQETKDICKMYGINVENYMRPLKDDDEEFILVDHNTRDVPGKITGIIDHHPPFENKNNLEFYLNEPASSTAILIVKNDEIMFTKKELEQAIVATLVDTASFHSVKTRKSDKIYVEKLINDYCLDKEKLIKTGLCLSDITNPNIALNGLKKYTFEDSNFESSYIQIEPSEETELKIKNILEFLIDYTITNNLDAFIFIVHDMINFKSTIYEITNAKIEVKNFDDYISRGTVVIPNYIEKLKQNKKKFNK